MGDTVPDPSGARQRIPQIGMGRHIVRFQFQHRIVFVCRGRQPAGPIINQGQVKMGAAVGRRLADRVLPETFLGAINAVPLVGQCTENEGDNKSDRDTDSWKKCGWLLEAAAEIDIHLATPTIAGKYGQDDRRRRGQIHPVFVRRIEQRGQG